MVGGTPRLGVPVKGTGKFIAIGLNYADHAQQANLLIPAEQPMFTQAISCLSGPNDDVMLPKDSSKGDWEVELGVVSGALINELSDTLRNAIWRNSIGVRHAQRIAVECHYWVNLDTDRFGRIIAIEVLRPPKQEFLGERDAMHC